MAFEEIIKSACEESFDDLRKGDKECEVEAIQKYILDATNIIIPNKNGIKLDAVNKALLEFGLSPAECLSINTNMADSSRMPVISKALMAVDQSDADLIIARGRLGLPGSGSLLVFMDFKGRILTVGSSPSHVVHKKPIEKAVYDETVEALERIGFKKL